MKPQRSVAFTARLMPPRNQGGQEQLSARVLQVLRKSFPVEDLAHHGGRSGQWAYLAALRRRLRKLAARVDLLYVDGSDGSLAAPLASSGARSMMRVNGKDVFWRNSVYRHVCRRYFPRVDRIIANSSMTRMAAIALGARPDCIQVIHPVATRPVDWQYFPEPSRVLVAARLVPVKGVVEFVRDTWPIIAATDGSAFLDIAGDGPCLRQLEAVVDRLDQPQRVTLHGTLPQEALNRLYQRASVVAVPSRSVNGLVEGFGMVAAEAAVRGIPSVAFSLGGLREAVMEGVTGILVKPDDSTAMAHAVQQAIARRGVATSSSIEETGVKMFGSKRFEREYRRAVVTVADG